MSTKFEDLQFSFGDRRLVGQQFAREHIQRVISSGRISHAYLLSGPSGIGKTAFALAFAEILNGIDNLTTLGDQAFSKKSTWFTHPDIHLFLPLPTSVVNNDTISQELRPRLELLKEDPYEIVNFRVRPSLTDEGNSKNLKAFYPIDYFRGEIRPKAFLKPNEGRKTVIILQNIDEMRTEAANAFLKLLEEPSEDLVFILTTEHQEHLLPTIISRCQLIRMSPLKTSEVKKALITFDGLGESEAEYLARISGGNYAMTRFFDIDELKSTRDSVIEFLRNSYIQDAVQLIDTAEQWHSENNIEGQIAILNILEVFIRDLMVYRDTKNRDLLTNYDKAEVIRNFCEKLGDARLEQMIEEVNRCKPMVYQNVQPKLLYTRLSLRFSNLMRDKDKEIPGREPWKHLPAFVDE
ncbi:MAG: DNA polymerase III subunit delta' C-terminal domain-containing protein [Balneolaceae bacterium]|nr:DNA polymerase III subunit delta' C-terminal domain-containing protein [Balneolaceae bacterium]